MNKYREGKVKSSPMRAREIVSETIRLQSVGARACVSDSVPIEE